MGTYCHTSNTTDLQKNITLYLLFPSVMNNFLSFSRKRNITLVAETYYDEDPAKIFARLWKILYFTNTSLTTDHRVQPIVK